MSVRPICEDIRYSLTGRLEIVLLYWGRFKNYPYLGPFSVAFREVKDMSTVHAPAFEMAKNLKTVLIIRSSYSAEIRASSVSLNIIFHLFIPYHLYFLAYLLRLT